MNEKEINTNNFNIKYNDNKLNTDLYCENITDNPNYICKNLLIIELYRLKLYNKLKRKIIKIFDQYCEKKKIVLESKQLIDKVFLLDILSLIIMNYSNKEDVFFDKKSPFTKSNIEKYFQKDKCLNIDKKIIEIVINIFPKLDEHYIRYYKRLIRLRNKLLSIQYQIKYEIIEQNAIITLQLDDEYINRLKFKEIKYRKNIKLPLHIFYHLIKLFNNRIMNDYI